jgi:diacylglycerol kinase (ATP)
MKRILFIHNPAAGNRKLSLEKETIKKYFKDETLIDIITTKGPCEATEHVYREIDNYDLFVAIGGDGTVNEVGKALIGTGRSLGIVPVGSGNGLARELNMKMNPNLAMSQLGKSGEITIDTISVNNLTCLNVAGVGFEAEVAHDFNNHKRRGFLSYTISTLRSFYKYNPVKIEMKMDDRMESVNAFTVSFSNSRQFGNNAYISPLARLDDGLIDISVLTGFPRSAAPLIIMRLFGKTLHKSKYYKVYKIREAVILNENIMNWQIDGEPKIIKGPVKISVNKKSLKVVKGKKSA